MNSGHFSLGFFSDFKFWEPRLEVLVTWFKNYQPWCLRRQRACFCSEGESVLLTDTSTLGKRRSCSRCPLSSRGPGAVFWELGVKNSNVLAFRVPVLPEKLTCTCVTCSNYDKTRAIIEIFIQFWKPVFSHYAIKSERTLNCHRW